VILLVTTNQRRMECGIALQKASGEPVEVCDSVRKATSLLRNNEYSSVVLDEPMVETEGEALEALLDHVGLAVPVYINLAVSSAERIAHQVRLAARRHRESRLIALRAAELQLRSEIRDAVTGILLSTELAMRIPEVPADAMEKLTSVFQLASSVRQRLESVN